jgi:hypothetical protein
MNLIKLDASFSEIQAPPVATQAQLEEKCGKDSLRFREFWSCRQELSPYADARRMPWAAVTSAAQGAGLFGEEGYA